MKRMPVFATITLLAAAMPQWVEGQIVHILNAPFSAVETITQRDNGPETRPIVVKMARASNGSTYRAELMTDGQPFRIRIEDVPHSVAIMLFPSPPSFTYTREENARYARTTPSVNAYAKELERMMDGFRTTPDSNQPDGQRDHEEGLGIKQEGGMTLFGRRDERTLPDGRKRIFEDWFSDLGIVMLSKDESETPHQESTAFVHDLRREEPDAKLFEIPKEYMPGSNPLASAKTVYVEDQTGLPEIGATAEAMFSRWKRMGVVKAKEQADLVAVLTLGMTSVNNVGIRTVAMKVYATGSPRILFETDAVAPGKMEGAAVGCVTNLINAVQNIRIGPLAASHETGAH